MITKTDSLVAFLLVCGLAGGSAAYTQIRSQTQSTPAVSQTSIEKTIADLRSTDPSRRESAACELKKMRAGAAPAIPALIGLLGDNSVIANEKSCRQTRFGNLDGTEHSPAAAAVEALIAIGSPVVAPVIDALRSDQWLVRQNAVRVLGFRTDDRAIDPLIAALRDDAWQVRSEAATALGSYKDSRVVTALIAALADQKWDVRSGAAVSLANYKDERTVEPLIAATKDEAWQVRVDAVVALANIRDKKAVEPLIAALRDQMWQVRMEAALGLAQAGDERAIKPLTSALQDENPGVRREAQSALDQISRRTKFATRG
jgi:HEAT repeat protein